ncbi:hypothetical protein BDD12DRAFT_890583 [Trichophaea hybrida]|nr:hypothetical protein BDD12DRAFT_890583 [Trichophaea hybrida]
MPQAVKSSAWPAQFRKSNGLIWPGLQATNPTAGRPGLSGTLIPNGKAIDLKILYTATHKRSLMITSRYHAMPENKRRAIFTWWTGIWPDHFTLDNEELENYDEIAICHLHRTMWKKSPSGHTAKAYLSEEPFEATVDLPFSSYIGDALVRKRKWNTAPVQRQCTIIFSNNDLHARLQVEKIQSATVEAYKTAFKQLMIEEETQYGAVSADGVPEPSPEVLSARESPHSGSDMEYEYSEEDDDEDDPSNLDEQWANGGKW